MVTLHDSIGPLNLGDAADYEVVMFGMHSGLDHLTIQTVFVKLYNLCLPKDSNLLTAKSTTTIC